MTSALWFMLGFVVGVGFVVGMILLGAVGFSRSHYMRRKP